MIDTAVMIVDMVEGFTRMGQLGSPRVTELIPKQVEFLTGMPSRIPVFLLCDAHFPGDEEFSTYPVHCLAGTPESNVCSEIMQVLLDRKIPYRIIPKRSFSGFNRRFKDGTVIESPMERYVTVAQNWIVMGCITDVCVAANTLELLNRGRKVIIARDLVDTYHVDNIHDADKINEFFLDTWFPSVWGVDIDLSKNLVSDLNAKAKQEEW